MKRWWGVCAGLLAALPSWAAAPHAVVEAVQAPAWVVRGDSRQPLVPGQELKSRDRVQTGSDARVLLRLAEGSAVKLGENATLKLDGLGRREGRVFTAALDVLTGAFRFTSGVFGQDTGRRAVNVRVATITAGIRGTDLWGSSDAERDLICLIEGAITVTHPLGEPVRLDEALSFYAAPKGSAPQPVATVDPEQLKRWAEQTELRDGAGVARRGARWKARLATVDSESDALELYDRVRAAGYPARILPQADGAGGYRYEVRLTQMASPDEARAAAARVAFDLQLPEAKISR